MNKQEKIKELEYLNNEHRGVIGILMNEREVLRAENEALKKENEALKKENEELSVLCVEFNVPRKAEEK
jgi:cell shape-determining protein MreC